jgi:CHAT domain-containing protein
LQQIFAKTPRTVGLYTITSKDRLRILIITGSTMVAREVVISEAELNKRIYALREVLSDPISDPKPAARVLYDALLRPIKKDLDQANADTLVLSLDGALRYVPVAVLFDGQHYMAELYATATVTPMSLNYLVEERDLNNIQAAAFGISRKYEEDLQDLPAVEKELDAVVDDGSAPAKDGILPGSISLNDNFTAADLKQKLERRPSIVHIASHFVLGANDTTSYLLLAGDKEAGPAYHLTVAQLRDDPTFSLSNVVLLTLSACETGLNQVTSNGREVDGIAMTAHLQGAKAVLSSLWNVNDESTAWLMADFYSRWAKEVGISKAVALQRAQLDLLTGKMPSAFDASLGDMAGRKFSHPFFWAPFVLSGNWR